MGDLEALAASVALVGLLQPIVINERYELIAGERRLRVFRDVLGRDTILACVVNLDSLVLGEHDENEVRKDFTPSERVAIAEAVQREVGTRQGQRTDKQPDELPANWPEVQPGAESR